MPYKFGTASLAARAKLHPMMIRIVDEAIKDIDFKILDATRGRAAQTKAFNQGNSKVTFGNSAHNYVPAIAVDLFPAPYIWPDDKTATAAQRKAGKAAFIQLWKILQVIPKRLKLIDPETKEIVKLRFGIDWNGDGDISDGWDMPHVELHPWRTWAKHSKLYED